jgi:hypothetical protein
MQARFFKEGDGVLELVTVDRDNIARYRVFDENYDCCLKDYL